MANEYTTFRVGVGTLKMYTGAVSWDVEDSVVSYLSIGGVEQTDLPTSYNNYVGFAGREDTTAKEYIITEDNTEVKIKGFFSLYGSTLPISSVTLQSELPTTWNMFKGCTGLTSVNKFNFKFIKDDAYRPAGPLNTISAAGMFGGCTNLTMLDLSGWDTSNVTDMAYMFQSCERLTTLDLSNWDTSNVTDISIMFGGCTNLTSLDLSGWDTSQVTSMREMFCRCKSLTTLDIFNFDTSKITNMRHMFYMCPFTNPTLSAGVDTVNTQINLDVLFIVNVTVTPNDATDLYIEVTVNGKVVYNKQPYTGQTSLNCALLAKDNTSIGNFPVKVTLTYYRYGIETSITVETSNKINIGNDGSIPEFLIGKCNNYGAKYPSQFTNSKMNEMISAGNLEWTTNLYSGKEYTLGYRWNIIAFVPVSYLTSQNKNEVDELLRFMGWDDLVNNYVEVYPDNTEYCRGNAILTDRFGKQIEFRYCAYESGFTSCEYKMVRR